MIINKLLPIMDNSRSLPSFYIAKNLKKDELEDVITLYDFLLNPKNNNYKDDKTLNVIFYKMMVIYFQIRFFNYFNFDYLKTN